MTQGFKQSIAAASKRDAGALPLIKALAPLQTLIHIGAGTGQGALHQWHAWDVAAAGHLQQGNSQEARQFTRLAQDWGCSKKLISQILISGGVHNSLGRAAAVSGQAQRALQHFQSSLQAGAAHSEVRLLTQARVNEQLTQLGLPLSTLQL